MQATNSNPLIGTPPFYSLALCFRDLPVLVNQPPERLPLSHRVEDRCLDANITCLVDVRNLPPERSVRSLLRPVPRLQDLVTTVWPDEVTLRRVLGGDETGEAGDRLLDEMAALPHVLYWVPRPSIPAVSHVEKRLAHREVLGGGGLLGNLNAFPDPLPTPELELPHSAEAQIRQHEERLRTDPRLATLQYDRRVFTSLQNTANGDVKPGLEFQYHEEDGLVWASYEGDGVELGMLVAVKDAHGRLRMAYQHINDIDQRRTGLCFSYPEIQPDGYLKMHEFWKWTSGDRTEGHSILQEKQGVTIERRVS